jgi:hypothetical protein
MPQICQFLGVNSVTNIELTTGFMPVLIFKFADWLENFPASRSNERSGCRSSVQKAFWAHIL